ncbi:YciI family protein [Paenibacillus sp. LMG 31461]|uniref:YciI family protein n=1 Tax=Paenibacillus plantarum TaxID=2654975 RepID=A0ABX1XGS9_9BACL|nr:YciI family protein [Paenibacillus plantarum]NOU67722.1 YciI family protein [Paenibacillus plantarum]
MRYILMVKATGFSEARVKQSQTYIDQMKAYKKSLAMAGVLLAEEELQPSWAGIRICYPSQGGEPELLVGPFPIHQELLAEYTLIDVSSEEDALHWALQMPIPADRGKYELELRKLEERSSFIREPSRQVMEADLQDLRYILQTREKFEGVNAK